MTVFNVRCENFEGPMDLLLYLIKINEIDIFNIPIVRLTGQYLDYLRTLRNINLDNWADFLSMASNLIYIKSKMLLPKATVDLESEDEMEDPRQELARKLSEYKQYKEAAHILDQLPLLRRDVFTNPLSGHLKEIVLDELNSEVVGDIDNLEYYDIKFGKKTNINNFILKILFALDHNIYADEVTVEQKAQQIKQLVKEKTNLTFEMLVDLCDTRLEVVTLFLALLELVKSKQINIYQNRNYAVIYILEPGKKMEDNYRG